MTQSGVKALHATVLTAMSLGKQVNVMYDHTSSNCWARYVILQR